MRKNILMILSDQHSKHMVGCYGNSLVRTPNIDRLAAQGIRFENAYTASPHCVPARMSFLTGRLPSRNRVMDNTHILSSGIPTFAHALGAAGYETALMGKMHFVGPDQRHGFELRPLGEFSARHPGTPEVGGPRWNQFPAAVSGQERVSVETVGTGTTSYQWFDRRVTDTACNYLREKAAENSGRPFASIVGLVLPHCPFIAPKNLYDYYYDRVEIPYVESNVPPTVDRFREDRDLNTPPLSSEKIKQARAAYYALCEHMDSLIGEILDCLEATGLAENTVVVYGSDHGEMAGEHGCWWKSLYYESSAGVPLVIRDPGAPSPGRTAADMVNLMDLPATFSDIAGADFPNIDGRSLMPIIRGEDPDDKYRTAFGSTISEHFDAKGKHPYLSRMIRSGPWKLWKFFDQDDLPPALFNLDEDPGEMRDLGTDSQHARIREKLMEELLRDWDPDAVLADCLDASRSSRLISDWGRATNPPPLPETLTVPPPEIQDDIVLFT